MKNYAKDQRGVAVLLELVLVAVVLGLAGLAVYQANHPTNSAALEQANKPAPTSTEGLAAASATIAGQEIAAEAVLSAEAEATTAEATAADADTSSLGSTSDASF